jgi:AAA+ ATPase superfamily predicted ATPase
LKSEFESLRIYKRILEAISHGKTTRKEIKDFAKLEHLDISQYLTNLIETEFVVRARPVFGKEKDGRYYLSDNFLKFWFRFVYPNLSFIEEGIFNIDEIKKEYNSYLGEIYENICLEFVVDFLRPKSVGKQWGKIPKKFRKDGETTYEIDIVAYDDSKLVFGECKWKDNVDSEKICKELIEKIQYVDVPNNLKKHKKELWIFAKSFKSKIDQYENYVVKCFDLSDLEKTYK